MGWAVHPGGQLLIPDWCDDYWACRVCDLYLRLCSRANFKVYGEREGARFLHQSGYTVVDIDRYKITWLWELMTTKVTQDAADYQLRANV